MNILSIFIIGLSLSIDAFTLSLSYGLLNIKLNKIILTSFMVSLFHFLMPLLGNYLCNRLFNNFIINKKIVLIVILIFIILELLKSINEKKEEHTLNFKSIITFSFLVSLDALSIGTCIDTLTKNIFIASTIFSLLSGMFTFFGFLLGKYISEKFEKNSKIVCVFLLLLVLIYLICK